MGAKRCYGCMKPKTQTPLCEHCGYNEYINNLSHQLPIGTLLQGRYEIGKVLGQGGFGITYIGWDRVRQTTVAVKEFFPSGIVSRESSSTQTLRVNTASAAEDFERSRRRFLQEANVLQKLNDIPQIVHVEHLFEENNTAYIVMEYIRGVDLRRYIRMSGGKLSVSRTLDILCPIMEALQKAHELGLVHRDVSPDNIMLMPDGMAKLLDFGAAREVVSAEVSHVQSTEAILKHGFAPIEQYQRKGALGPWTDVYALSATVYYCLTGQVPADAPKRIMDGVVIPWDSIPDLTAWQIQVLTSAMEPLPKNRIQSVDQVRTALFAGSSGETPWIDPNPDPSGDKPEEKPRDPRTGVDVIVDKDTSIRRDPPPGRWKRILLAAGAVAVAAAAVAALVFLPGKTTGKTDIEETAPQTSITDSYPVPRINTDIPDQVDMGAIFTGAYDDVIRYSDGSRAKIYRTGDLEIGRVLFDKDDNLLYRFLAEYNEAGKMLYQLTFDADNICIRADTYTYDEEDRVITWAIIVEDGMVYRTYTNTFREEDSRTQVIRNHKNEILSVAEYSTDQDGITTEKTVFSDGTVQESCYGNGRYLYMKQFNADGTLSYDLESEVDDEGRPVRQFYRNPDGSIRNTIEIVYDAQGREIESIYYDERNVQVYRSKQLYSGDERIGEETVYSDGDVYCWENMNGIRSVRVRSCSSSSYEISYTEYYPWDAEKSMVGYNTETGKLQSTEEYRYDEDLNCIGSERVYYSGYDNSYTVYSYDGNRRSLGRKSYDENGKLSSWSEPEYDEKGNVIKETTYYTESNMSDVVEWSYDENGKLLGYTSTFHYDNGNSTVYVYDGNYELQHKTDYNAEGEKTDYLSYKYEYDAYGKTIREYAYDENGNLRYWIETFYDENGNYLDSEWHYT